MFLGIGLRQPFAQYLTSSAFPANGDVTQAARGSVLFNGTNASYTYADSASFDFPDGDWFVAAKVRLKRGTGTRYIASIGTQGGAHNLQLYLANNVLTCQVRAAGAVTTLAQTGTLTINDGFYVVVVQRNGANIELMAAPVSGSASLIGSLAMVAPGAITPSGTHTIGVRSSSQTNTWWNNFISWVAKGSGTLSLSDVTALAAGQDIKDDLGRTLSLYTRLDDATATIADSSGNGNTATRTGTCRAAGGPVFSGLGVSINESALAPTWAYVYQRSPGSTSRQITVTGGYRGSPTGLEGRIVTVGGAALTDWTDCTATGVGTWQLVITVPQGVNCALEVRHKNNTAIFHRTSIPWCVGMRLLAVGESLSDQWTTTAATEAGYVVLEDNISVYNAKTPGYFDNIGNKAACANAASRLSSALGIGVMILGAGWSGSSLVTDYPTNWDTFASTMHTRTLAAVSGPGGGADFEAMVWTQGVNDGWDLDETVTAAQYQAAMERLVPQLRSYAAAGRTAAQNPFFCNIVGRVTVNPFSPDNFRQVRNGQRSSLGTITNIYHAGTLHDLTLGDNAHPDAAGFLLLGKRVAQAVLNYYDPATYSTGVNGPLLSSAAVNGTDIDLTFTLGVGSALRGKTGATGLTGFRVYGPSVAVSSITRTALTLTGLTRSGTTATGTTGSPHGLIVGQWILVSGATVSGSTDNVFNGWQKVTGTPTATTFTFTMPSTPAGNATGTIRAGFATVVANGHGLSTDEFAGLFGSTTREYIQARLPVYVVDANTIIVPVLHNVSASATGTITLRRHIAITTTAIPSADVVRLTPASAPAVGWGVDYLPEPQVDITNLLYSNAPCIGVAGNDTVPANPATALITV